jgi:hypothetical protein
MGTPIYNSLYPGATFKKTPNITTNYRGNPEKMYIESSSKPSLQNPSYQITHINFMTQKHWF